MRLKPRRKFVHIFLVKYLFGGAYSAFHHVPCEYIIEIHVQIETSFFRLKSLTLRELRLFDVCNMKESFTMLYLADVVLVCKGTYTTQSFAYQRSQSFYKITFSLLSHSVSYRFCFVP